MVIFLHWKAQFDPCLQQHLQTCRKNASYKSPDIQIELIHLAGLEVRDSLLCKIKSAGWLSVMADECTDIATIEQMSICIRFVDDKPEVGEAILGFVKLDCTDAESISTSLLSFLKSCNLDLTVRGMMGPQLWLVRCLEYLLKYCNDNHVLCMFTAVLIT